MADYKSQQLTNVDGQGAEREENGTFFGRIRQDWFNVNSTDEMNGASTAAADTVELARLPAGARILGVFFSNEDWGTDVSIDVGLKGTDGSGEYDVAGTADDPDFLVNDVDITTARTAAADVINVAGRPGYLTDKAVTVYGTIVNAGTIVVSADKDLNGYVQYVVD